MLNVQSFRKTVTWSVSQLNQNQFSLANVATLMDQVTQITEKHVFFPIQLIASSHVEFLSVQVLKYWLLRCLLSLQYNESKLNFVFGPHRNDKINSAVAAAAAARHYRITVLVAFL